VTKDAAKDFNAELSDLNRGEWTDRLQQVGDDYGYYQPLGEDHAAVFVDAGKSLIVTFESRVAIRKTHEREEPRGFDFTRQLGWSSLSLISNSESWFRDEIIFGYFDRLMDDGFFEDFQQVLFFGNHAGGYAAAAYSVAAPGARVLAIRPQATLDPSLAGWDHRYLEQRRTAFDDRYGYAPDMLDAADHAWIVFDPVDRLDSMHAALFAREHVTQLRAKHLGWKIEQGLEGMGALAPMIVAAMEGSLSPKMFAKIWRTRREYMPYLRGLLAYLEKEDRPLLTAWLCRQVTKDHDRPLFASKLAEYRKMGVLKEA